MSERFDVVVLGAGSVGTPTALALAEAGLSVAVVDERGGPGFGSHKTAIGGVRATHSDVAKIRLGLRSLEVFRTWAEARGDDLEWSTGGYVFAAWREKEASALRGLVSTQRALGLEVSWLDAEALLEVAPDLERRELLGGTFSPGDGHCSPLLAMQAFHRHAARAGAVFRFGERALGLDAAAGRVTGVRTSRGRLEARFVVLAAGAWAEPIASSFGMRLPVRPDEHEAGITEPVAPFLDPLVVDLRPGPGSANVYFFQHRTGQVIFCLTPSPALWGDDTRETSGFLPAVARRMIAAMPRLASIRVRRTWRGLYPMTPDGMPLVGWSRELEGVFVAAGMCGQGFMLGPALGELVARAVLGAATESDRVVLDALSPYRGFAAEERLK